MYTLGGLFAGVGGIEKGFERTGNFKVLWANEKDKFACKTYRKNHDHKLYEEDIYNLDPSKMEPVDILTGGFPCQAFSIAGYRKGFDDERGELFFEIMRFVDELPEKPKVLFLENVKNLKSHDDGKTFKTIEENIKKRGYSFISETINTSDVTNIPQNRERTYMICFKDEANWNNLMKEKNNVEKYASHHFSKLFPPETVEEKIHVQDILDDEKMEDRYYYTEDWLNYDELSSAVTSRDTVYQWRRVYVRENQSNEFPTLTANMGTGGHNVPIIKDDYGIRKLTPRECFRLQGFGDIKMPELRGLAQLYKQAGNMVTIDVVELIADMIYESLEYKYQDTADLQLVH